MQKIQIRLISSPTMTERQEHDTLRVPLHGRASLEMDGGLLLLGKGSFQISVRVRPVFRDDLPKVHEVLQKERPGAVLGFVSNNTFRRIHAHVGDSVWLSEDSTQITLGCDPEFGLVHPENNILAAGSVVLPGTEKKPFGCDGPGVEVRPPPSQDHVELVGNLKDTLAAAPPQAKGYKWIGGATFRDRNRTYWFGGHIHIGRPPTLNIEKAPPIYSAIAKIMDHLLALPLVSFDTPEPFLRRDKCPHGYGKAGDIRTKPKNGPPERFEYRVLSGLWFTHPVLARIVLGAAKAVAEAAYLKLRKWNYALPTEDMGDGSTRVDLDDLLREFLIPTRHDSLDKVSRLINQAAPEKMESAAFKRWEEQITSMPTSSAYAKEIEALIAMVKASPEGVVDQLSLDIPENWQGSRPLVPKADAKLANALAGLEMK